MANIGRVSLPFKHKCPFIPPAFTKKNIKNTVENVTFTDFIARLTPHFTIPETEVIRLVNCVFHEILDIIRDGKRVNIPYFGTFIGHIFTSRLIFNIGLNMYDKTPKIIQRCQPNLLPSTYACHVCSPKNAFRDPVWYTKNRYATSSSGAKLYWYKNNIRFHKRSLMLYDNPYSMSGINNFSYTMKESTGKHFPSETDLSEMRHLESMLVKQAYAKDKKVIRRFVLRDFLKKNKSLFIRHNYLPGKYFVGDDNNFYMTEEEHASGKTRYEVIYDRIRKNKQAIDKNNLPDEVPEDLTWDYFEMEVNNNRDESSNETDNNKTIGYQNSESLCTEDESYPRQN